MSTVVITALVIIARDIVNSFSWCGLFDSQAKTTID